MSPATLEAPPRVHHPADWALRGFVGLLIAVVLVGAVTTPGFLTADNFRAILTATAFVGIIAVGATAIMIGGSLFSLSLGVTTAVTSIIFLSLLDHGIFAAAVITLLAGALICGVQGGIVGAFGANPIIVTIGAASLQEGLTTWRNAGNITPPPDVNIDWLAATVWGLPISIFVFFAVALAVDVFLRRTRSGQEIYFMGENRRAARAAGFRTGWLTTATFTIAGICVAITGILIAGFNQNSNLAVQGTFTFDAIAAVLVGGNAVTGGFGSTWRTVLGALVLVAISDMLLLRGASTGEQILVKGLIVIVVVVLVHLARREGKRS